MESLLVHQADKPLDRKESLAGCGEETVSRIPCKNPDLFSRSSAAERQVVTLRVVGSNPAVRANYERYNTMEEIQKIGRKFQDLSELIRELQHFEHGIGGKVNLFSFKDETTVDFTGIIVEVPIIGVCNKLSVYNESLNSVLSLIISEDTVDLLRSETIHSILDDGTELEQYNISISYGVTDWFLTGMIF